MPALSVPAYQGLRFFLVLAVMEGHYAQMHYSHRVYWPAALALPFFLVLSGYLITDHLLRVEDGPGAAPFFRLLARFYFRRIVRIMPAYYVVLLAAAACMGVPYLGWHLLFAFNLKLFWLSCGPSLEPLFALLRMGDAAALHFWSMGVEEQFYVLYPPLLLLCPGRLRTLLLSLALTGAVLTRHWFLTYHPDTFYGVLLPVAGEFLMWGALVAWLDWREQVVWLRSAHVLHGALAAFGLLLVANRSQEAYRFGLFTPPADHTLFGLCMALVVLGLRYNADSPFSRLLCLAPFRRLGGISYSCYLVHPFLNPVVDAWLQAMPFLVLFPTMPRALAGPVLCFAVAALLWGSFEGPLNRWRGSPVRSQDESPTRADSSRQSRASSAKPV